MAKNLVELENSYYPFFSKGVPISSGHIYVGDTDTDPTLVPNQKQVTALQEDGVSVPISQPIRTGAGGVPELNGSPVQLTVDGDYSIAVLDSVQSQVYYNPRRAGGTPLTISESIISKSTIAEMVADLTLVTGQTVCVDDYATGNKSGILFGNVVSPGTGTADGGQYIDLDNGLQWEQSFSRIVTPKQFGAVGDGTTNDDAAFTAVQNAFPGAAVDLSDSSYEVTVIPSACQYFNGAFNFDSVEVWASSILEAPIDASSIGDVLDTGGAEAPFTGGANNTPTTSGRTTFYTRGVFLSQNCRAQFARSVNMASIYAWAYGNVSGNYSARQSVAGCPQGVNLASEECETYGFRGVNLASIFSETIASTGGNLTSRLCSANAVYAANISSNTSKIGGVRSRLTPVVSAGVVTSITIDAGGSGYDPADDTLLIIDRTSAGSGATATFTVDGSGSIDSITVTSGGSGYPDNVVQTVAYVRSTSDHVANVATELCNIYTSTNSGNFASSATTITDGSNSAALGCSAGTTVNNLRSVALAATSSSINDFGSVLVSCNNSHVDHNDCVMIGRRTRTAVARTFVIGDAVSGSSSTANRKFQVTSGGNVSAAGTITPSVVFTDYAEMFENLELGEIAPGSIVTLEGKRVRPAKDDDFILGVVSQTAAIVAGDSQLHWSGRYKTNEWGGLVYHDVRCVRWVEVIESRDDTGELTETKVQHDGLASEFSDIPSDAEYYTETVPVENPDFDLDIENTPRSQRPEEWTCVGLVGQLHVRTHGELEPGDWVGADGRRSKKVTCLKVMEIKKPFDGDYGIALCARV